MTLRIAISVSYYGRHRKGDGQVMDAGEHQDMLYRTLCYLKEDMHAHNPLMVVCASGCEYPDVMAPVGTNIKVNPVETGNPDGSWWALCEGVRFAVENGCDYLLHTCEDVIPNRGVMADMMWRMHNEELDYIGALWRPQGELATQFFGCRPKFIWKNIQVQDWDMVAKSHGPEMVLGSIYRTYTINQYVPGTRQNVGIIERNYGHSHTYSEFLRMMEEVGR